ncbi:MAG: cbb3-type cytochrome c oxidase subunit 3 [Pseudomonadota bacterium]
MEFIANNSGIITTILFFTIFVGVGIWSFLPKNKKQMSEHAMIPLEEQINE